MMLHALFTSLFVVGISSVSAQQAPMVTKIKQAFKGVSVRSDVVETKTFGNYFQSARDTYRLINLDDYECDVPLIFDYIDSLYAALTPDETDALNALDENFVSFFPPIAVLIKGGSYAAAREFYPNKQQTTEFNKRFADLKKFWDVYTKDISLYSVSGQMFRDDEAMIPAIQYVTGVDQTEAQKLIDAVQETFAMYPAIGYNFPLWTLLAFAAPDDPTEPTFNGDKSIVIGDGIRMFAEYAGIEDASPDTVLYHEMGHFVQLGLNFTEMSARRTPETIRYIELMADSLAGYFAHHPRGASFQAKRIVEATRTMYDIGDCFVNSTSHHGTPNQREKAVQLGVDLVGSGGTRGKGKILKAAEFKAKFDAAFATIVAPDKVN